MFMYQNEEYDWLFSIVTWEPLITCAFKKNPTSFFSSSFYCLPQNFLLFLPVENLLLSKDTGITDKRRQLTLNTTATLDQNRCYLILISDFSKFHMSNITVMLSQPKYRKKDEK